MGEQQPEQDESPQASTTRERWGATAAAGAALAAARTRPVRAEDIDGANDRVGVGFVGVGLRGGHHLSFVHQLREQGKTQIVGVCDAYGPRARGAASAYGAKVYQTYDELLDDADVDVVCIATPDRHHVVQALEAVRRGKDLYVEKPLTHWSQYDLARELEAEVERRGRIVQVGTQYIAHDGYAEAARLIKEGAVGKIVHVQAAYFRRGDWGERMPVPDPNAAPGPELDWQMFLGDAPQTEFSIERFFQWRMFWDYAGGPATDLLYHVLTPVVRMLDLGAPQRVFGGGGTYQYDREVPDQCSIVADYADGPSILLTNSLSNFTPLDTVLRGTDGAVLLRPIDIADNRVRIVPLGDDAQETVIPLPEYGDTRPLWKNLIECVRTRQQPISPISLALRVQLPLTMGILSHRASRAATYDATTQRIAV